LAGCPWGWRALCQAIVNTVIAIRPSFPWGLGRKSDFSGPGATT